MSALKTVLFQGDSVTDCGRLQSEDGLGSGYPKMVADLLSGKANFINRGVSGNRTRDLVARWDDDCIAVKPDILVILIGINDTWRAFDSHDTTTADQYFGNYNSLLLRMKNELPDTKIILLEPFVLPSLADKVFWRTDLDPKIHCVRQLAIKHNTGFIPLDGIMAQKSVSLGCAALCDDGVHPTPVGHKIIADYLAAEIEALL